MKYKLVTYPDERLKIPSLPVTKIDDEIINLINDMFDIMYATNGIGLAAVQIGFHKRIFVVDIGNGKKIAFINPEIVEKSEELVDSEEGCLSFPGVNGVVKRHKKITVKFLNEKGNTQTIKASGLLAICIQHEYDHLEGKLYIERLPAEIKLEKIKEYRKLHTL